MRITMILSTILALSSPLVLAGEGAAKCDCTKKCHSQCKAGHAKNCKCSHCGCAKGEKCDSGCHDGEKAEKSAEAPSPQK